MGCRLVARRPITLKLFYFSFGGYLCGGRGGGMCVCTLSLGVLDPEVDLLRS